MAFPNPIKIVSGAVLAIPRAIARAQEEQRRKRELEEKRIATPPCYDEGVSESEFTEIVMKAKREIPRIKSVAIEGFVVRIEVKSMTGITIWTATIDFNDFGHLTGWYKVHSENDDSKIPQAFAREVNESVLECKAKKTSPKTSDETPS